MALLSIVTDVEIYVSAAIWIVLFAVKIFALADAIARKGDYFVAADKQNKAFWLVILVLAVLVDGLALQSALSLGAPAFLTPLGLLPLIGTTAALVYLAGVRPRLRELDEYGR